MHATKSRFAWLVLLVALLLILAACGNDTGDDAMEKQSPGATLAAGTMAGDAMKKDAGAMPGDAMQKDGGTMTGDAMMAKLPDQIFAAHYVDSAPAHGQKFAAVPARVLINFNFTLSDSSIMRVTKDGAALVIGKPVFDERNLSMSVTLPPGSGDGLYVVDYKACWPDRSCHDGRFAFTADSKTAGAFIDMRGKGEVRIAMKESKFAPASVIVSKGTKVTWVNEESTPHFVNSDPHPSHNFLPTQNSLELKQGQSFGYTFNAAGEWPYHCSLHYPAGMVGRVLVQ